MITGAARDISQAGFTDILRQLYGRLFSTNVCAIAPCGGWQALGRGACQFAVAEGALPGDKSQVMGSNAYRPHGNNNGLLS